VLTGENATTRNWPGLRTPDARGGRGRSVGSWTGRPVWPAAGGSRMQLAVEQIPECSRGKKPRIRVTLHQRVDLELSVVEDMWWRRLQVEIDRLTNRCIQTHLIAHRKTEPTHEQNRGKVSLASTPISDHGWVLRWTQNPIWNRLCDKGLVRLTGVYILAAMQFLCLLEWWTDNCIMCSVRQTQQAVGAQLPRYAAAPLIPLWAPKRLAPPSRRNIAVVSHGQYVPTLTAAAAWRVNMAVSKAAWWPWPLDLEIGVRATCDVGYLCANLSLPRPLCSRFRPDRCTWQTNTRQTDRRQTASSLYAPAYWGGHNNSR